MWGIFIAQCSHPFLTMVIFSYRAAATFMWLLPEWDSFNVTPFFPFFIFTTGKFSVFLLTSEKLSKIQYI